MGWTDISQYAIDDILGFQSMNQIVDNFDYLFVGGVGQTNIDTTWLTNLAVTEGKLGNSSVAQGKLKTSTGVASGTVGAGTATEFVMQDYSFSPNVYTDTTRLLMAAQITTNTGTVGRFALSNITGGGVDYVVRWRYVTATDEPFIYAIQDKKSGVIDHVWMCEDPPPGYWGLDDKSDDFVPPVVLLGNKDKSASMTGKNEITIFKHPKDEYFDILERSDKDKKQPSEILNDAFEYDKDKKLFKTKNITEV